MVFTHQFIDILFRQPKDILLLPQARDMRQRQSVMSIVHHTRRLLTLSIAVAAIKGVLLLPS